MQVLVWDGKHGAQIFDASTPEALEASAREILRQLVQAQWIFPPEDPMKHIEYSSIDLEQARLSDDEIAALPTESMRKVALKHKKNLAARYRQYESDKVEYEMVLKIIAGEPVLGGMGRPVTAWNIVQSRDGAEYENYELEKVWTAS